MNRSNPDRPRPRPTPVEHPFAEDTPTRATERKHLCSFVGYVNSPSVLMYERFTFSRIPAKWHSPCFSPSRRWRASHKAHVRLPAQPGSFGIAKCPPHLATAGFAVLPPRGERAASHDPPARPLPHLPIVHRGIMGDRSEPSRPGSIAKTTMGEVVVEESDPGRLFPPAGPTSHLHRQFSLRFQRKYPFAGRHGITRVARPGSTPAVPP
jgi:hypothetical protein